MKTHVGVDLHQRFCYLTAVDASGRLVKQGQVVNEAEALRAWLGQVASPRQVVVEASGFWPAFVRAASPVSDRVVMVHPRRVKAIASARLKNDRVDSETLAQLSRADLLPEAWMAEEATQQLRLLTRLRIALGGGPSTALSADALSFARDDAIIGKAGWVFSGTKRAWFSGRRGGRGAGSGGGLCCQRAWDSTGRFRGCIRR